MTSSLKRMVGQGIAKQPESGISVKRGKLMATKTALLGFIFIVISIASNANGEDLGSFTNLQKAIEATKILSSGAYNQIKQMFEYGSKEVALETKDGNVVITIIEDSCKNASEKADPDKYGCRKYQVIVTKY